MFWQGEFLAICGDGFWENSHGASLFCKKLGHDSGYLTQSKEQSGSGQTSLFVGRCRETDRSLVACSGGFNSLTTHPFKDCTAAGDYKMVCLGGTGVTNASCKVSGMKILRDGF